MNHSSRQSGTVSPLLVSGIVVFVVVGGAVMHRCLTCGPEDTGAKMSVADIGTGRALRPSANTEPASGTEKPDSERDDMSLPEGYVGKEPLPGHGESRDGRSLPKLVPLKDLQKQAEQPKEPGKYLNLTFAKLGNYKYVFPEIGAAAKATNQIPESVVALSGKDVEIKGFMIPIRAKDEDVLEFVLVVNQLACCYGVVPKMNEWLHVTMADDKKAPYAVDLPITVRGKLDVGELWENGIVMSLYRIECEEVIAPKYR